MAINPQLSDPENGDFSLLPTSPAQGFGAQTFGSKKPNSNITKTTEFTNRIDNKNTTVGGPISENTIWSADTIFVDDDITILNDVTLQVDAGTTVVFEDFYGIEVMGSIKTLGTYNNFVKFTSKQPELFQSDTLTSGSWSGIRFINTLSTNDSSKFEYTKFEYAKAIDRSMLSYSGGGAIFFQDFSKARVENCIFENSLAFYGGAIYTSRNSNPFIVSNLFKNNYAYLNGSCIAVSNSNPWIINNTIVNNTITNPDVFADNGTVYLFCSKPIFMNNIMFNNEGMAEEITINKPFFTLNNNFEIEEEGETNISEDPQFQTVSGYEHTLSNRSPCVNTGNTEFDKFLFSSNLPLPEKDLLGNPRVNGSNIDMGAFEYSDTSICGDENIVTTLDIISYPNPFNPETTIKFNIEKSFEGKILVYGIDGKLVKELFSGRFNQGLNSYKFNASNLSSGMYNIVIKDSKIRASKKVLFLK